MSEAAVSYAFEQLEPSDPPPRDAPARALAEALAQAEEIREHARQETEACRRNGPPTLDEKHGGDHRAQGERAVGSDVGERKDAKAEEHPQGQQT